MGSLEDSTIFLTRVSRGSSAPVNLDSNGEDKTIEERVVELSVHSFAQVQKLSQRDERSGVDAKTRLPAWTC